MRRREAVIGMNTGGKVERNVLVLQGGGALGAYQAGAYEGLARHGYLPDWVAGISIGAINAAIIAGNAPERRIARLRACWQRVTSGLEGAPVGPLPWSRRLYGDTVAAFVMAAGAPGFFSPRIPPACFMPKGASGAISVYDTAPLSNTLAELVDFDLLNRQGPRLSVGAVDVATGNFAYFDSSETAIGPDHIMASGALPPGFPPVIVEGRAYWDGGLVSNTPLQFVLENDGKDPLCIFQIDLFSARGAVPTDLGEVSHRKKDIRYSSRTRLTTDRFRQLQAIGAAARRLVAKLPDHLRDDPDVALLEAVGARCPVTLAHLIHRKEVFETQTKDYEFSRLSMIEHWAAGKRDAQRTLTHKSWKARSVPVDGIQVFDLGRRDS